MRKLFLLSLLVIGIMLAISPVYAAELPTVTEAAQQIKDWAVAAVLSFISSGSIITIASFILKKSRDKLNEEVDQLRSANKISAASATAIYATLDRFEQQAESQISLLQTRTETLITENATLSDNVRAMIATLQERDARLNELLKLTLVVTPDGTE